MASVSDDGDAFAIGIDIGTTYSRVAVWQNNHVVVVPNQHGNRATPSCVAFSATEVEGVGRSAVEKNILVGEDALDATRSNHQDYTGNTGLWDVKRLIGRKFNHEEVQSDLVYWPFRVVEDSERGGGAPLLEMKGCRKRAEEIMAHLLVKMKILAEKYLDEGKEVRNVVLSVPASFQNAQRQAIKDAATIAGLHVVRLIHDTTAVALSHYFNPPPQDQESSAASSDMTRCEDETVTLVIDWGGGTLDVSLVTTDHESSIIEVKATAGDCHLGGRDMDNRMVDFFLGEVKRRRKDISSDHSAVLRIRAAWEQAKQKLSQGINVVVDLEIENLVQGQDDEDKQSFFYRVHSARFCDICRDYLERCLKLCDTVIQAAAVPKKDIHEILLAGGSSRIPKLRFLLMDYFGYGEGKCEPPKISLLAPDQSVVAGAALQAARLAGQDGCCVSPLLSDLLILDVIPHSLRFVQKRFGMWDMVVRRNANIPVKVCRTFSTHVDNQRTCHFDLVEGESASPRLQQPHRDNIQVWIKDIPQMPRGQPQLEVTLEVDNDGLLQVSALEKNSSVAAAKLTVTLEKGCLLSANDIERISASIMREHATDSRDFGSWCE